MEAQPITQSELDEAICQLLRRAFVSRLEVGPVVGSFEVAKLSYMMPTYLALHMLNDEQANIETSR